VAPAAAGMPESFNLTYDTSNRLIDAVSMSQWIQYEYDAGNKRILEVSWTGNGNGWTKTADNVHFYGVTGQRLGTYPVQVSNENTPTVSLSFSPGMDSVWFGGRLVQKGGTSVPAPDRLGSIGRYLPYGEERTGQSGNPANGNEKFATYTRDGVTGLDYADQRWYAQGQGRFLTSDPYQASAGAAEPGSWNRYGYVEGDPVGAFDPNGLASADAWGDEFLCMLRIPYTWFPSEVDNWYALACRSTEYSLERTRLYDSGPAQRAGGRPTGTSFRRARSIAERAAKKFNERKQWHRDCEAFLGKLGTSGADLAARAGDVQFGDASTSNVLMSDLYALSELRQAAIAQYGQTTIATHVAAFPTKALAELKGTRVFIDPRWWGSDPDADEATVLHEIVHLVTGLTDDDFERILGTAKGMSALLRENKCI
jgi:RHS repeat-associated protein